MKLKIWIVVILGIYSAEVLGADVIEPSRNPAARNKESVIPVGDGNDDANDGANELGSPATLVRKDRMSLNPRNPNVPACKSDTVSEGATPLDVDAGIPRINSEGTESKSGSRVGTPQAPADAADNSQTFPGSLPNN